MHLKFKKPQNYRTIQAKFIFRLFIKRKDEFVFVDDLDLGTKTGSHHKEYSFEICKLYHLPFKSYGHVYT